jgi:hypothetical protein
LWYSTSLIHQDNWKHRWGTAQVLCWVRPHMLSVRRGCSTKILSWTL